MNNCGRGDLKIDPYINLPLSGEVPRRGGGGTEGANELIKRRDAPPGASGKGRLWHGVAGRGKRDDTPVHSLPQSRPLADPASPARGSLVNLPLSGEVPRRGGEGTVGRTEIYFAHIRVSEYFIFTK